MIGGSEAQSWANLVVWNAIVNWHGCGMGDQNTFEGENFERRLAVELFEAAIELEIMLEAGYINDNSLSLIED
ncbi:hypothetical protein M0R45_007638 [Rubus argutus]|uniref:Uncharacterized protein n=1 Tax=Rubus argutus TaxID=59490 RepID=A0AAW1XZB5_RUBAR